MTKDPLPLPDLKAEQVIAEVERLRKAACRLCGSLLCPHDAVVLVAMGFKNAPTCTPCLAGHLGKETGVFRAHVQAFIRRHDCLMQGWSHATDIELPAVACPWKDSKVADPGPVTAATTSGAEVPCEAQWDAGEMSCGDLVLELRMRLRALGPRGILRLTALDLGAPEDIPAWCNLTGNTLIKKDPPTYLIMKG